MDTCTICGRQYEYNHKAGHTHSKCNSCSVNQRRFKIKQMALEYKGGCCQVCGYSKCERALDFHHRDKSTKLFGISGAHARSWDSIKKELDKCDLLCCRCHMETEEAAGSLTG
jgi:hypothetical protein